ncbi:protein phosphatase 1 regulatory subunit 16A-like [Saccostrea echinata]|uniref:protein phosphatase 1 regulatory subunit 16A-like n=1 Tax=Saccostrea echinata TaxID=191078 RepID=UPI002A826AB7|nr:protein phosphatase 1 regulatory subunit 16A-like [Saccostrea echinata]
MSRAQSRMSARTGGGSRATSAKSTKSPRHPVVIHSTILPMSKVYLGKEYEQRLANAAGTGDLITVIKILKFNVSPDSRDEHGQPALVRACMGGHAEIASALIEAKANINIQGVYNATPLHAAVKGQNVNCVKHVILGGAQLIPQTTAGLTPQDMAKYGSEVWEVINDARKGDMPEIDEISEVPEIPDYALPDGAAKKKKGKKGKKSGKKKGGKKGKKKGGKKKKKK